MSTNKKSFLIAVLIFILSIVITVLYNKYITTSENGTVKGQIENSTVEYVGVEIFEDNNIMFESFVKDIHDKYEEGDYSINYYIDFNFTDEEKANKNYTVGLRYDKQILIVYDKKLEDRVSEIIESAKDRRSLNNGKVRVNIKGKSSKREIDITYTALNRYKEEVDNQELKETIELVELKDIS